MDREINTIKTPIDKREVVLKAWITGRERRELRKPFMDKLKVSTKGEGDPTVELAGSADIIETVENKAIETIVVSIDGVKDKILETILDMKEKDYSFVIEEINKITGGKDFTKPE